MCDYCSNGFQTGIEPKFDGSYMTVGSCADGFRMTIDSWCGGRPSVRLTVTQWSEKDQVNHDIVHYTPKFCPECGRKITENEKYLKQV